MPRKSTLGAENTMGKATVRCLIITGEVRSCAGHYQQLYVVVLVIYDYFFHAVKVMKEIDSSS